jgi:hypothetical protein
MSRSSRSFTIPFANLKPDPIPGIKTFKANVGDPGLAFETWVTRPRDFSCIPGSLDLREDLPCIASVDKEGR